MGKKWFVISLDDYNQIRRRGFLGCKSLGMRPPKPLNFNKIEDKANKFTNICSMYPEIILSPMSSPTPHFLL